MRFGTMATGARRGPLKILLLGLSLFFPAQTLAHCGMPFAGVVRHQHHAGHGGPSGPSSRAAAPELSSSADGSCVLTVREFTAPRGDTQLLTDRVTLASGCGTSPSAPDAAFLHAGAVGPASAGDDPAPPLRRLSLRI